jgi:hypothetical protein
MQGQRPRAKLGSNKLWPREHGAYAEVLFPLGTALALGQFSLPSIALSIAIVLAFLAHEPVLVLLGARGGALQREAGPRARVQGAWLAAASAVAGALGLSAADSPTLWATAALLPILTLVVTLTLTGRERSLLGEALIALLFAFAAVPVSIAAGSSVAAALQAAATWSVVFIAGTATVHALIARKKRGALAPTWVVVATCAVLSLGAALAALSGQGWWLAAATPMMLVCAAALVFGLSTKRLRLLGWSMVFAQLGTAVTLCASLSNPASAAVTPSMPAAPATRSNGPSREPKSSEEVRVS